MKKAKPITGFKSVESKNKAQAQIYSQTKNMTNQELAKYYLCAAEKGPFADKFKQIRSHQEKRSRKKAG
jgi:hypothetical protein